MFDNKTIFMICSIWLLLALGLAKWFSNLVLIASDKRTTKGEPAFPIFVKNEKEKHKRNDQRGRNS